MDNPNITMNALFADACESFKKYEHKQKTVVEERKRQKRRKHLSYSSSLLATANADKKKPLFGSWLNPFLHLGTQHVTTKNTAHDCSTKAEPPRCCSINASSLTDGSQDLTSSYSEDDVSPNKTMSLTESQDGKQLKTIASNVSSTSISSITSSIPVAFSEIERRERVCAAIRRLSSEISEASSRTSNFKPLLWNKPSFEFKSDDDGDDMIQVTANYNSKPLDSDSTIQRGKRKAPSDVPSSSSSLSSQHQS